MKSIPSQNSNAGFTVFEMKIDTESTYTFCDVGLPFKEGGALHDLGIESILSLPNTGIYEHKGLQFGIFKVPHDGVYPIYESDDMNDPDLILMECDEYFEDDDPVGHCLVDSACIALIPPSFLPDGLEPAKAGPAVDFARFDEEDYEDSSVSIYCNNRGIYIIDRFLVRDFRLWKN